MPALFPSVSTGQSRFASAAQGYELESLDLNQRYIVNPPATFLVRCEGDSMENAGILPGAVLVVDRSIKPRSSHIVIAEVDGEFLVKTLYKRGNVLRLLSENPAYPAIEFEEGQELPEAKQMMISRSFGERLHRLEDLERAIAFHARTACERMRSRGLHANGVFVFIQNSPHDKAEYYSPCASIGLPGTTASTLKVTQATLVTCNPTLNLPFSPRKSSMFFLVDELTQVDAIS